MKKSLAHRYPAFLYRDYRLLWSGQLISNIGSQMQLIALNWQIYILTHSALALGVIGLARVIPIIIFSLIGGSVADTYNRKKIMVFTQTAMLTVSLLLTLLTLLHHITPLLIYVLTALAAIARSFDLPARQALVPRLVKREHLGNALNLNSIMFQTSTILGPMLGGIIIGKLGTEYVYGLDSISFIAVLTALYSIKSSGAVDNRSAAVSFRGIHEGITFIKTKTIIWSTMLLDFFCTFFGSATALLPIFAKDILKAGPEGLGLLYAGPAIGAVIGGLLLANITFLQKEGAIILTAIVVYGLGTIAFGLSHSFILSLFALIFVGLGDNISTIIRGTVRQLATPDFMRGRMTSINMIFAMGGPQLGEFEAGVLASAIGAPLSVVVGGFGTLIAVAVMGIGLPALRKFDQKTAPPL